MRDHREGARTSPHPRSCRCRARGAGDRPRDVRRPVDALEDARSDPVTQQRDHGDHAEQVERERAQARHGRACTSPRNGNADPTSEPELGMGTKSRVPTSATTTVRSGSGAPSGGGRWYREAARHGPVRPDRASMPSTIEIVKRTGRRCRFRGPRAQRASSRSRDVRRSSRSSVRSCRHLGQPPTRCHAVRWSTDVQDAAALGQASAVASWPRITRRSRRCSPRRT